MTEVKALDRYFK